MCPYWQSLAAVAPAALPSPYSSLGGNQLLGTVARVWMVYPFRVYVVQPASPLWAADKLTSLVVTVGCHS